MKEQNSFELNEEVNVNVKGGIKVRGRIKGYSGKFAEFTMWIVDFDNGLYVPRTDYPFTSIAIPESRIEKINV